MSSCQRMLGHWCPGLDYVQRKAHEYSKKYILYFKYYDYMEIIIVEVHWGI